MAPDKLNASHQLTLRKINMMACTYGWNKGRGKQSTKDEQNKGRPNKTSKWLCQLLDETLTITLSPNVNLLFLFILTK